MMRKSRHDSQRRGFLSTTHESSTQEHTGQFPMVPAARPDLAGAIPKGLPLRGEVAVAGGDTQEEAVVGLQGVGVIEDGNVGGLGRRVHLFEYGGGEGFGELVEVCPPAEGLYAGFFGFG